MLDSRDVATFQGGDLLTWNLTGSVRLVFTNLASGSNAVLSALYFGPAAAAQLVNKS